MPTLSPPPYQDVQGSLRWHAWFRQINDLLELTSISIDNIDDVTLTSPADDDVFTYDGGTNKWVNEKLALTHLGTDFSDLEDGWASSSLDDHSVAISESGGTITLSLEKNGGGDLRVIFSDGIHTHDCTPADTVTLTAGTDAAPQQNFVYILQSNKTLTNSTSGWPAGEHMKIAEVVCQSAASLATDEPMHVHVLHEATYDDNTGQIAHLTEYVRAQHATWLSGVVATPTIDTGPSPDTIDLATTSGSIRELHEHTFPAFDTSTGSVLYIVNDNTAAYTKTSNIEVDAFELSDGTAKSNGDHLALVIWGVQSEDQSTCKLFCNLPSAWYRTESNAIADVFNYADHSIPAAFKNSGFLIARLTIKYNSAGGGQFTIPTGGTVDLRGTLPGVSIGGATSQAIVEFADNTFLWYDESDDTKQVQMQLSGITTATTRTITMPDADVTLAAGVGQVQGDVLDDLNTLGAATADGEFLVATGAGAFAYETGTTARQSLGFDANAAVGTTAVTASSHTHAVAERFLLCDTSSNAITVDLLAAATAGAGYRLDVKVTDATNAVTIDGATTETIDGSTTKVLSTVYDNLSLVCDGSNWHIL